MGKIIYAMSVSLDGYIEAEDGDFSWLYPDEELHRHFNEVESQVDIYLYGSRMYKEMSAFWPTADKDPEAPDFIVEYARIWQNKPKIVFSKTLKDAGWNTRIVKGDMEKEVIKLKEQDDKTMSVSGAKTASALIELNLIDEYRLYIHPVILGGGKPMLPPLKEKVKLRLVETHTFGSGVVMLRYQCVDE